VLVVAGWGGPYDPEVAGVGWPSGTVTFVFTDIEGSTAMWDRSPRVMATMSCAGFRAVPIPGLEGLGEGDCWDGTTEDVLG
jgi:class 3 adenylate cyclase